MAEDKKIIVDEDWKQKAQKEKETLKEKEEEQGKAETPAETKDARKLPQGNLSSLLSMLATQAMFAMGLIGEEGTEPKKDMQLAKFQIDILESLEEKTKGNLTDEEEKMLKDILSQLRMTFVSMSK
ncbi:MAG: DUF1844 domain-containing protein [Anaerohalosphaeraceae bacterium]|nr:DUF1844 domain-containing protein [Anaerohalosphaeraceae bacterium]